MTINIPKKKLEKVDEIALHHGFKFMEVSADKTKGNCFLTTEEKKPIIKTFKKKTEKKHLTSPTLIYFDQPVLINQKNTPVKRGQKIINLDIMGVDESIAEAMVINTSTKILREYGFKNICVDINCIGGKNSVKKFVPELINHYKKHSGNIDCRCKQLIKNRDLNFLNCGSEKCKNIIETAPKPIEYLSENSQKHFKEILEYLEEMNVAYKINNTLLTADNQYSKVIFEIKNADNDEILGIGGRYDDTANQIARKRNLKAVGISMKFKKKLSPKVYANKIETPKIFLIQFGFRARLKSFEVVDFLRKHKINIYQNIYSKKLSDQFYEAKKAKVPFMIIIGQKEAFENSVIFRNMEDSSHEVVKLKNLLKYLKKIKLV